MAPGRWSRASVYGVAFVAWTAIGAFIIAQRYFYSLSSGASFRGVSPPP